MAKMWPQRLPREVLDNSFRKAEVAVYNRLGACLDHQWVVFYSRPWLGLTRYGEEVDGEADFVVAHPEKGYLTIEVKGGSIEWNPSTDQWTSTDRDGLVHRIKDPVKQARDAKYEILRRLRNELGWGRHWIRIRHGVIFPHCDLPRDTSFGMDRPSWLFCDRGTFNGRFADWIADRFSTHDPDDQPSQAGGLGHDGMKALHRLLAEPLHFHAPLSQFSVDDDHSLGLLTVQQFHLLDMMEDQPRVAVRGGAGTGKTVLAMESARRRARLGERVLFICYNRGLARRLRRDLAGSGVTARSFHRLCRDMADAAGIPIPTQTDKKTLHEVVLPELLVNALDHLPDRRFDTVIVDEGQDFRPHWWPAVDMLLRPGRRAKLQIFYDANQRLYGHISSLPEDAGAAPFRLTRNLRNTRRIHEVVMKHYEGIDVLPNDVLGSWPEAILTEGDDFYRQAAETVVRLVRQDRYAPDQIAVLVANENERCEVDRCLASAGVPRTQCDESHDNAVTLDTIRRFKGLEAHAVVLVATPAALAEKELAYVALSRARGHLLAVGDQMTVAGLGLAVK